MSIFTIFLSFAMCLGIVFVWQVKGVWVYFVLQIIGLVGFVVLFDWGVDPMRSPFS